MEDERLRRFPRPLLLHEVCGSDVQLGFNFYWGASIGYFCSSQLWEASADGHRYVVTRMLFRRTEPDQPSGRHANPRLELFCRRRCSCREIVRDRQSTLTSLGFPPDREYEIHLNDPYDPDVEHGNDREVLGTVQYVERFVGDDIRAMQASDIRETRIGLRSSRKIRCDNTAEPEFRDWTDVSYDWSWSDIASNTELCANLWEGGLERASAGGVCVGPDTRIQLEFYDEFVPNTEFRLREHWWHIAGGVRAYCRRACRCDYKDDTNALPIATAFRDSAFGRGGFEIGDNGMMFHIDDVDGAGTVSIPMIPPPDLGSDKCRRNRKFYCGQKWPEHLLGPKPWKDSLGLPSSSTARLMPQRSWRNEYEPNPVCGQRCSRRADCPGASSIDGCQCRAMRVAKGTGDVVVMLASCWVLQAAIRQSNRLGARDEEAYAGCVCNATYISEACCAVGDAGMVWEPVETAGPSFILQGA
ncbi:MAG: hypothetical protein M1814_001702 [Vezdaea aestivalis]|nr:MAG: hypothetical protein M1814_001702 [Vezdaea aestivalis]